MVAASRHLLQFAREQEQGTFQPVTVTRHDKRVLTSVPFTETKQVLETPEGLIERARAIIATLESQNIVHPDVAAAVSLALDTFMECQRNLQHPDQPLQTLEKEEEAR